MIGHMEEVNDEQLERTSLVSDWGWSLFTNTYGIADASHMGEHCAYPSGRTMLKAFRPGRSGTHLYKIWRYLPHGRLKTQDHGCPHQSDCNEP